MKWTPEAIKQLRTDLQLSQEKFAVEVGVVLQTVHRWEKVGGSKPSFLAIEKLDQLQERLEAQTNE